MPDLLAKGAFFQAMKRYKCIHRRLFGHYNFTMPPKPPTRLMKKLNMTMKEFLIKYDCEALASLFELGHSMQGYGLVEHIPAFYGLWWFPPELFWAYLPPPLGKNPRNTAMITMIKEGYGEVWSRLAKQSNLDVILNFNVTAITRHPEKIVIEGIDTNGEQEASATLEFDYLIVTSPLKKMLNVLNDPSEEELEVFSKLHKYCVCTTLYSSDLQKGTQVIEYRPHALPTFGRVFAQRHSAKCVEGSNFRGHKDTYVAYQFTDPKKVCLNEKEYKDLFMNEMKERGITNIEIIEQQIWPYFYHFDKEEINKGYPWKILDMQGRNRTLYSGASASFESVNDVMNYNLMLLHRFVST